MWVDTPILAAVADEAAILIMPSVSLQYERRASGKTH